MHFPWAPIKNLLLFLSLVVWLLGKLFMPVSGRVEGYVVFFKNTIKKETY